MQEITVQFKTVYGNDLIYPICDKARMFARLSGAKTLTEDAISIIKGLGYVVNVIPSTPSTL